MNKLAQKLIRDEQEIRLSNWGRYVRSGSHPGLDYTTWGQVLRQYLGEPDNSITINEIDGQRLEDVISTLDVSGRNGFGWGELWSAVLRVEYVERPEGQQPAQEQKAKDISRKFNRPCSSRTYRHNLWNAKRAVFSLIDPL